MGGETSVSPPFSPSTSCEKIGHMGIPRGYCYCGCGERTWIPTYNSAPLGYVKGVPCRWKAGHKPQPTVSEAERLAEHVVDEATGCWVLPKLRADGYAQFSYKGKAQRAHRFYYERHVGPIPEGMDLDHLCRNRGCVNPAHMEPVTRTENLRRGSRTRLNPEKVREIKKLLGEGRKKSEIAPLFGISAQHVGYIAHGKSWADVV